MKIKIIDTIIIIWLFIACFVILFFYSLNINDPFYYIITVVLLIWHIQLILKGIRLFGK